MDQALTTEQRTADENRRIVEIVERERVRLLRFIRARVPDERDAEDLLQDVFYELLAAYRLMQPIEQIGAWLFRVARNRIIDLFRKKRPDSFLNAPAADAGLEEAFLWEDFLPSHDAGPDAQYARGVLLEELETALDELPEAQRDVFVAHEMEGRTFKELAEATGLSINTLLSRKHYAVRHLRQRLEAIHTEFSRRGIGTMRRLGFARGLKFVAFAVVGVSAVSAVAMALWNWLMPTLFHLPPIGFWQALGLLALSRILFGGFRGRPGGHRLHWRHRLTERWQQMTPEERDEFTKGVRGGLRGGCGPFGSAEPQPKS